MSFGRHGSLNLRGAAAGLLLAGFLKPRGRLEKAAVAVLRVLAILGKHTGEGAVTLAGALLAILVWNW